MTSRFVMTAGALQRAVDADAVQAAIRQAELRTSCEIRVSVSHFFWGDVRSMAARAFARMGLARTAERNGVLIFVVPSRRRFEILADVGIDAKAGQATWDAAAAILTERFAQGRFTEGLVSSIAALGESLVASSPRSTDDVNELPDAVDYGPSDPEGPDA